MLLLQYNIDGVDKNDKLIVQGKRNSKVGVDARITCRPPATLLETREDSSGLAV